MRTGKRPSGRKTPGWSTSYRGDMCNVPCEVCGDADGCDLYELMQEYRKKRSGCSQYVPEVRILMNCSLAAHDVRIQVDLSVVRESVGDAVCPCHCLKD